MVSSRRRSGAYCLHSTTELEHYSVTNGLDYAAVIGNGAVLDQSLDTFALDQAARFIKADVAIVRNRRRRMEPAPYANVRETAKRSKASSNKTNASGVATPKRAAL